MANVKITALTDIGANILYTSLIPMVNMAGTPTTEKGNIQILGNYILSGAGSANFAPAALSNLSYSVVNAAQPNITSVGTLTSLTVTGNITSGDTVTADFFVGDGGFLTNVTSAGTSISNGTSNVSIPTAGGNILFSRGGTANVVVISGTGANVNGTFTTANLNVTGNVTSNLLPNANVVYDLGSATQRWKDLWLSNSTIYIGNSTISAGTSNSVVFSGSVQADGNITANTDSNVTIRTVGGVTPHVWSFGSDGNLTLPNNTFAVNYANGTQVPIGGGGAGLPLANGTSNFNIATVNGNATITANGTHTWEFDNTGNLTLPGNTFAVNFANGDPIVLGGNTIGNFVVTGNMFMLNDPNIDMVIQQSATDITSIRLIPDGSPDSGVHIETGNISQMWHWHFEDTGNTVVPGNVELDGTQLFVGPGAALLPNVANATLAISSNSEAFIQAIINNVSDIGSADWIAQGHYGDDDGGYIDLGFNSSAYNDPVYGMTAAGDGYIIAQGYYSGQAPSQGGGNLVLTTGDQGLYKNIIFGTGGFGTANIFATISDANNALEITRPDAYIQLPDGSVLDAGGLYGNDTAILSNGSGAVQSYAQSTGFGIQTGDGNATIHTWTFDNTGKLVLASGNSIIYSTANSSLDPLNPNVSTMTLTPDANYNSQVLVLDPTAPGHIHLRAYASSNIDDPAANIFLGGEQTAFEITQGANNVARIHSGNLTWTFSNNSGASVIDLPGESALRSNNDTIAIQSYDTANGIGRGIYIGTNGGLYFWDGNSQSVSLQQDNTNANLTAIGNVSITSNVHTWTFDTTGNLTVPKSIIGNGNVQLDLGSTANEVYLTTTSDDSTALHMTDVEAQLYANSNVYVNSLTSNVNLGANSDIIITSNTANVNQVWTFGANGNLTVPGSIGGVNRLTANIYQTNIATYSALPAATTAGLRAFISDANLVAASNFGTAVSGGGSNTVPVYSDGTDWRIG